MTNYIVKKTRGNADDVDINSDDVDITAQPTYTVDDLFKRSYGPTIYPADVISKGPWVDVRSFGASGSSQQTTGSITVGEYTVTLTNALDFANGMGVRVAGAGASGADLVASVESGGGTTILTLDTAASTTVTDVTVEHDDHSAFQAAYNYLRSTGGVITAPAGTYNIDATITCYEGTAFRGSGFTTIIKRASVSADPIFLWKGTDSCGLYNCKLDGNNAALDPSTGLGLLRIAGSSHCRVENAWFTGSGGTLSSPGGSCIMVTAYESGDTSAATNDCPGYSCIDNTITNCFFYDDKRCKFAIRMITNWDSANATLEVECSGNHITNNHFDGFTWNTIGLEGPATTNNMCVGNTCRNHAGYNPLDLDKGASYNVLDGNSVYDMVQHVVVGAESSFIRVSGTQGAIHLREAIGNVVSNNTCYNLGSAKTNSRGILVYKARDNLIEGNTLDVTIDTGNSFGIEIDNNTQELVIRGNLIRNASGSGYGIRNDFDDLGANCSDWYIENNVLEAATYGIYIANTDAGGYTLNNIVVRNNVIRSASNTGIFLDADVTDGVVDGNVVYGGATGIVVDGDDIQITNNVVKGVTTRGIRIKSNSTQVWLNGNWVELGAGATESLGIECSEVEVSVGNNAFEDGAATSRWQYAGHKLTTNSALLTSSTALLVERHHVVFCDSSGGAFNVNLPTTAAAGDGVEFYVILHTAGNNVTVQAQGTDTIEGGTITLSAQYDNCHVIGYDGVYYRID